MKVNQRDSIISDSSDYQTDTRFILTGIFVSNSVILSLSMALPYAPMPVRFYIHSDCLQLNPDRRLTAARSNPKSQPQRPNGWTVDKPQISVQLSRWGQEEWTVRAFLKVVSLRPRPFFEVEAYRRELDPCFLSDHMLTGGMLTEGKSATSANLQEDRQCFQPHLVYMPLCLLGFQLFYTYFIQYVPVMGNLT